MLDFKDYLELVVIPPKKRKATDHSVTLDFPQE